MKLVKIILSISIAAILLCGCAATDNNVNTNSESSAISINDSSKDNSSTDNDSQSNPDDLLKAFISSGDHLEYTAEYTETATQYSAKYQLLYVIVDLNSDAKNELLIEANDGTGFNNTWLFTVQNDKVSLVFEHYGFGSFRYSPSQNAVIVPPEFRPFIGASCYSFYTLEMGELKHKFSVGEIDIDQYSYWTDESKKAITKDELASYLTDAVAFEWIKIEG